MKKALICGVSGQDGAYLTRLLLNKGYKVWGTSRDTGQAPANLERLDLGGQVDMTTVSLTDAVQIRRLVDGVKPDEIYNLSGPSSVGLSWQEPQQTLSSIGLSCLNLLEAVRRADAEIKLYNAGSCECFGDTLDGPADENTPFNPVNPYGTAKAAATWMVRNYRQAYGLFVCTGILFNHDSPLRPNDVVTKKIVRGAARIASGDNRPLQLGSLAMRRDWGWAPEYVEAIWLTLQQEGPGDYAVATGEYNSLESLVERAFALVGLDWREHVIIDESLFRPAEISLNYGNPAKAARELPWTAKSKMNEIVEMLLENERAGMLRGMRA